MGARGRKSGAELVLARPVAVEPIKRPSPPITLSDEEGLEWRAIVDSMPADFFGRAVHAVLEQYCRHAVAARVIGRAIQTLNDKEDATEADYNRLLRMQERESRALAALAVRLGIATATHVRKAPASPNRDRLWIE